MSIEVRDILDVSQAETIITDYVNAWVKQDIDAIQEVCHDDCRIQILNSVNCNKLNDFRKELECWFVSGNEIHSWNILDQIYATTDNGGTGYFDSIFDVTINGVRRRERGVTVVIFENGKIMNMRSYSTRIIQ